MPKTLFLAQIISHSTISGAGGGRMIDSNVPGGILLLAARWRIWEVDEWFKMFISNRNCWELKYSGNFTEHEETLATQGFGEPGKVIESTLRNLYSMIAFAPEPRNASEHRCISRSRSDLNLQRSQVRNSGFRRRSVAATGEGGGGVRAIGIAEGFVL